MKVNFIDKTVAFFSPSAGLRRMQRKAAIEVLRRGYEGARKDRRTAGWRITNDAETAPLDQIQLLKQRSRDLYRNNPYAYNAHNVIADNTTGTAILPAIKDDRLKKTWREWATSTNVDFDQHLNFYGIQNLCMRTMSMHGEVLVLRIKTEDKVMPLELKVVRSEYLDTTKDEPKMKTGGYIKGGIQFNGNGKREGYWIFDEDPTLDIYSKSTFWKEADVIHLFKVEEPGQIRGVPFGAASIMPLRDYDDYADAQLTRQKVAACFSIFITKTDADMVPGHEPEERFEKVQPGLIQHLDPGKEVTFASPPAAEGYGEYSRNVLSSVASGFGVSYEAMTGDLKGVNFSSGRMGWLEYQRKIENWQAFIIIPKLCNRVWTWFVEAGTISGLLTENTPAAVDWTPPGRAMIDPSKEVKGLADQVRAGFMSWQEAVRTLGYSPEEVLSEMKAAAKDFDAAGLQPTTDPRYDKTNVLSNSENSETDDSDADRDTDRRPDEDA